ncbi:hypothetical protein PNA2_1681 [Pyrococcus sp. NA2]|uniref:FmdE family protein n=1 Tax=Pyrococcus sp. (strain NA2) TaxID=342949 RepID=UPI000209AAA2|nr:FmdE family protein [Pyrococcus sp. NA2]AEC52596.1 hypothetical protein PNA2_1681 [Pyrococcus sp. NA2]
MKDLSEAIRDRDLEVILEYAKMFHGHICPYLALGIRASIIAMEELGVERLGFEESVDEAILAIVETNSCFTDGVQVTTGCTLGNNSLIYLDTGKTALTLVKRGSWEGVRVYVDAEELRKYYPEGATELFEKVVKRREGTPEERKKLARLWEETGKKFLKLPKEVFKIKRVKIPPIEQAPIFESVRCSECGELVMAPKVIYLDGRPLCKSCAGEKILGVIGRGIVEMEGFKL